MMSHKMALQVAIDLFHVPSQVRFVRAAPLPDGIPILLRIAAGDEEAEVRAAALTDRSRDVVRQAARFFVEQILLAPCTDSYRVLGASPQASISELRRNLALLSKWLHPDRNTDNNRSIFIDRVTAAWNDLKTPERRAKYDQAVRGRLNGGKSQGGVRQNKLGKNININSYDPTGYLVAHTSLVRRSYSRQRIGLFRVVLSALFRKAW